MDARAIIDAAPVALRREIAERRLREAKASARGWIRDTSYAFATRKRFAGYAIATAGFLRRELEALA